MKYLVIGLGNFGNTLACKLTDMGHEVLGVDIKEANVEEVVEKIAVAYILDATDKSSLSALPLDDIDCTVVTIGKSMDQSLRIVAALKELGMSPIYARAIDTTHCSILRAMHLKKVFIPERVAAEIIAEKVSMEEGGESIVEEENGVEESATETTESTTEE